MSCIIDGIYRRGTISVVHRARLASRCSVGNMWTSVLPRDTPLLRFYTFLSMPSDTSICVMDVASLNNYFHAFISTVCVVKRAEFCCMKFAFLFQKSHPPGCSVLGNGGFNPEKPLPLCRHATTNASILIPCSTLPSASYK